MCIHPVLLCSHCTQIPKLWCRCTHNIKTGPVWHVAESSILESEEDDDDDGDERALDREGRRYSFTPPLSPLPLLPTYRLGKVVWGSARNGWDSPGSGLRVSWQWVQTPLLSWPTCTWRRSSIFILNYNTSFTKAPAGLHISSHTLLTPYPSLSVNPSLYPPEDKLNPPPPRNMAKPLPAAKMFLWNEIHALFSRFLAHAVAWGIPCLTAPESNYFFFPPLLNINVCT